MQAILNFIKSNKLLTTIIVLIIIGLLSSLLIKPTGFRIIKTDPALKDVATFTSFIKVEFSEPIVKDSVVIPSQNNVKRYEVSTQSVKIFVSNLEKNKRATIAIDKVMSATTGKQLGKQKLSFKPKDKEWHQIPKEQQESVLNEQQKNKSPVQSDPIMQHLPRNTLDYKLTAVVEGNNNLRLQADITPSSADTRDDDTLNPVAVQQYKDAVVNYIKSLGLDPAKYKITYTVIHPHTGKPDTSFNLN